MSVLENIMSNIYNNHAKPREAKAPGENAQAARNAKALSEAAKAEMLTELKSDGKSYVRGTVTDLRQDRIQLKLMSGETINARTESALPLSIGDTADFYVTANDGQLVTLKLAQDSMPPLDSQKMKLLESALQASNIQINDRTLAIANELMEHSQALNAANIRKFMTLSAKFPDTEISNLVLMDINKIPVTRENVDMLNAFNSGTAKLMPELDKALGEIREELSGIRDPEIRAELENELEAVMKEFETGTGTVEGENAGVMSADNAGNALAGNENVANNAAGAPAGLADGENSTIIANGANPATRADSENVTAGNTANAGNASPADSTLSANLSSTQGAGTAEGAAATNIDNTSGASNTTNPAASVTTGDTNIQDPAFSAGNTNPANTDAMNASVSAAGSRVSGAPSDGSREDNALGRTSANSSDPRAILPGEVSDPEIVKNFYKRLKNVSEKLDNLTDRIREATARQAEATLKEAAEAGGKQPSHASNLNSSLKFMDALNNVFPYLQLPIKLKEENAHGELYVYQKKRALKDGENLSALLHLELDNLGTTDIYVKLNGKNVYTSFSVADNDAEKIFASEMPSLDEALQKKGYSLSSDIKLRDKKEDNAPLLTEFLEAHSPSSVSRFTFDMRA